MSIGQDLAQARHRAGLTVGQISQRTRIRETIIRGIERDDYSGCGGDFYARGHIRAIARAVGADADPLIGEYDAARAAPELITAADTPEPAIPVPGQRQPNWTAIREPRQPNWTAVREPRRPNWTAILALALLAAAAIGAYLFFSGSGQAPGATAGAGNHPAAHRHHTGGATHPAASATASRGPSASPSGTGSSSPAKTAAVRRLAPASAVAFGPGGPGHGDNPALARLAIDRRHGTSWHSDWYTTAHFGNLQSGTGLLLDMGRRVTITGARIKLGGAPGADIQLRVGNAPTLARLQPVAAAANAGGPVRLTVTRQVRARYVLLWFTRLPPDTSGTFQARVYNIGINGRP